MSSRLALPALVTAAVLLTGCGVMPDRATPAAASPDGIPEGPPRKHAGSAADGELRPGATVYDDQPGVVRLEPQLREQLRAATADAAAQGIGIVVNSGWRSADYQSELFDEAVGSYGSEDAAAQWVARPGTSVHEAGAAVDVGPRAATDWLEEHGADYGLCQVYDNEPWHFELDPDAVEQGCPSTYDDPTDDPRLQG